MWSNKVRLHLKLTAELGNVIVNYVVMVFKAWKGHEEQLRPGTMWEQSGSLRKGTKKPLVKVKPQLQWRPQNTWDARTMWYPPKKAIGMESWLPKPFESQKITLSVSESQIIGHRAIGFEFTMLDFGFALEWLFFAQFFFWNKNI